MTKINVADWISFFFFFRRLRPKITAFCRWLLFCRAPPSPFVAFCHICRTNLFHFPVLWFHAVQLQPRSSSPNEFVCDRCVAEFNWRWAQSLRLCCRSLWEEPSRRAVIIVQGGGKKTSSHHNTYWLALFSPGTSRNPDRPANGTNQSIVSSPSCWFFSYSL